MNAVRSVDGTNIAYRTVGEGHGVVIVHGAMQSSANFTEIVLRSRLRPAWARWKRDASCGSFDRHRGRRSESGALEYRGAARLRVALCAAQSGAAIDRVAAYEPPFTIDGAAARIVDDSMRRGGLAW